MLTLGTILKGTGAAYLAYHACLVPALGIYAHFLRQPYNLSKRYGPNSWALITGGSDGIGKGYAHQLAKRGFNIYIIALDDENLTKTCDEIEQKYKVETKCMAKDFAYSTEPTFFDDIFEDTQKLDISVLVNNVGLFSTKAIIDESMESARKVLTINTVPQMLMCQEFIRRMLQRPHKSGIVNMASILGSFPVGFCPIYSAAKGCTDYLSRSLRHEFKDKIDISK